MMPDQNPEPDPPPENSFTWPILINLTLLVLVAIANNGRPDAIGVAVVALALLNAITAAVAGFKRKLRWVVVFVLTTLVILLIGFGACMLAFSKMGHD